MSQRLVVLTGSLQINSFFTFLGDYETLAANALRNYGFNIASVRFTNDSFSPSVVYATIECYVDSQYSAEQARASAVNVLKSIPSDSWVLYGAPQFSNISLRVLSDNKPLTTNSDAVNNDSLNAVTSYLGGLIKDTASNTAKNSMTPIAVAVGVVALIWVLKH